MILLADESVDRHIVERLRQDGHDTIYVAEPRQALTTIKCFRKPTIETLSC